MKSNVTYESLVNLVSYSRKKIGLLGSKFDIPSLSFPIISLKDFPSIVYILLLHEEFEKYRIRHARLLLFFNNIIHIYIIHKMHCNEKFITFLKNLSNKN